MVVLLVLPQAKCHTATGDATLADAILELLIPNAYKIKLKDESVRKKLFSRAGKSNT